MAAFFEITAASSCLALGLFGVGRVIDRSSSPAAALVRGWAVFFLLCTLPWFFAFPVRWIVPGLWMLVLGGLIAAARSAAARTLAGAAAGCLAIGAFFALPFLLHPGLLAYAHWGTDQWGYASVSRWLVEHSVRQLPTLDDNHPGLDWVWHVLKSGERPMVYLALAALSGTFGFATILAYFAFPAALAASIFLSFFLEDRPFGFAHPAARWLLSLGVSLQPLIFSHFQHQFLGGSIMGLVMMLLAAGLVHAEARDAWDPGFFGSAFLLATLSIGLYALTVSMVGAAVVAGAFAWNLARRRTVAAVRGGGPRRKASWIEFAAALAAALACYLEIRRLVPDQIGGPIAKGAAGHPWVQLGSLFGEVVITPWYAGEDAPGWLNPLRYDPWGGGLRIALLAALMALLAAQAFLWIRRRRSVAVGLVLLACAAVLWRLMPPRGSHWLVSRSLPIFGPMLIATAAAAAVRETRRGIGAAAAALACLPLLLAAPGLEPLLARPVNQFYASDGGRPPQDEAWHALAYAYFFEGTKDIDWSAAPNTFRGMTYYIPEEIRPKLRTPRR